MPRIPHGTLCAQFPLVGKPQRESQLPAVGKAVIRTGLTACRTSLHPTISGLIRAKTPVKHKNPLKRADTQQNYELEQ
jgi:hypothetical protein